MTKLRFVIFCGIFCAVERATTGAALARQSGIRPKSVARIAQTSPEQLPAPPDFWAEEGPAEETASVEQFPARPSLTPDESWRYRYHMKRWWYFVEPGHWLFWDGRCWQDAHPTWPKKMPDGSIQRVGIPRRALAAWPQVPSYNEHHGWVGGFYSSGGGYGSSDFGYGYGIPSYGPTQAR